MEKTRATEYVNVKDVKENETERKCVYAKQREREREREREHHVLEVNVHYTSMWPPSLTSMRKLQVSRLWQHDPLLPKSKTQLLPGPPHRTLSHNVGWRGERSNHEAQQGLGRSPG